MKKFTIYTRLLPGMKKGDPVPTSLVEVEIEIIQGVEDPSVMWMPKGEYKARVMSPTWLYEAKSDKDKTLVPPIWYPHAFYLTIDEARGAAEKMIRGEFEFAKRKRGIEFTEEEVLSKCAEIKEIMLP